MKSPAPSLALAPMVLRRPPTMMVGSKPPASRTRAVIEVVVVLPCEPATAMPYFIRMSSASISARGMTGMRPARAFADLDVVLADGRGNDDDVGVLEVLGPVADGDVGAQAASRRVASFSWMSEPETL